MKKANILFAVLLTGVTFLLSSCIKEVIKGNGITVTETRSIDGFTRVRLDGSGEVTILKGTTFKVTVTESQNILPYVKTTLSGGELTIGYKNDAWVKKGNLKVAIEMPVLEEVVVDGSGSIAISGGFNNAGRLKATMSGSGDIFIHDGNAEACELVINGSGDIKSFGLAARKAMVKINGSGDAELKVTDALDVSITGSGDVYYTGNPAIVNTRISGSGRVFKR